MKNEKIILLLIGIAILVMLNLMYFFPKNINVENINVGTPLASPSSTAQLNIFSNNDNVLSTTTPIYLTTTDTASSTQDFYTGDINNFDFNLFLTASSSPTSILSYILKFSNNNIDYYGEDVASVSGKTITHVAGEHIITVTDTTASTTKRNISIPNINSKYVRIEYGITGANGSVYFEESGR